MENFGSPGEILQFTAPAGSPGGVVSGEPVLIGSLLVIPSETKAAGQTFRGAAKGVFYGEKVQTEAWTECQKVYWDDAASLFTEVVGSPANPLVGVAAAAARAAVEMVNDSANSPQDLEVADNVLTVNDYTGLADKVLTITLPRDEGLSDVVLTLTEGVDYDAETDNPTTAANLAAAITALPGVSAVASQTSSSPPLDIITVTVDAPVRGRIRLDGVAR